MKKVSIILSAVLLVLSCNKIDGEKTVDLAKLSADYEAKDGETLTGIMDGNYKITIADGATVTVGGKEGPISESPFTYKP